VWVSDKLLDQSYPRFRPIQYDYDLINFVNFFFFLNQVFVVPELTTAILVDSVFHCLTGKLTTAIVALEWLGTDASVKVRLLLTILTILMMHFPPWCAQVPQSGRLQCDIRGLQMLV